MRFELTAQGIELTPDLRERVQRRVYFALGRHSGRITRVSIRLQDVNGPRGGPDKFCLVRVEAGSGPPVVIRERQSNVHAAVAFAAERAERFLSRQLRRRRFALPDQEVWTEAEDEPFAQAGGGLRDES